MRNIGLSEIDRRNTEWKITKSASLSIESFFILVTPFVVANLMEESLLGFNTAADILYWQWIWINPLIYVFIHPDYFETTETTLSTLTLFIESI